jgi:HK97 family phage prohead protease
MPKNKTVEHSNVSFEIKAVNEETGTIEGYASTWSIDQGNDIITKGAFAKTIKERVPAGKVKLLDSHRWDATSTIGTIVEATEDDHGLYIKAKFSSSPDAQAIRTKVMEGHLDRMSIGYIAVKERFENDKVHGTVRILDEVKLYEVSVVAFPMNEEAQITSVKSLDAMVEEFKAGRRNSEKDLDNIKQAIKNLFDLLNDEEQKEMYDILNPEAKIAKEEAKAAQQMAEYKSKLAILEAELSLF